MSVEPIIRFVLVVPTFKSSQHSCNRPKDDYTFHVFVRMYFDRAGWDEMLYRRRFLSHELQSKWAL